MGKFAIPAGTKQGRTSMRNRLLALEPRMLYDGAAPVIVDKLAASGKIAAGKEDTPTAITNVQITDAAGATEHVTLTALNGTLTLAHETNLTGISGEGTGRVSFSGSLADINNAINGMTFLGAKDVNGNVSFNISVDNGNTASSTINLNLSPVNDPPMFTGGNATVGEGETLSFTPPVVNGAGFTDTQFGLSDVDNSPDQVIIKITSLASHGTLTLDGNQLAVGSTLSASQLGDLKYTHDGTQVLADSTDMFGIAIDDGAGGLLTNQTVSIHLTPVDQAPDVRGTITVVEGEKDIQLYGVTGVNNTPLGGDRGSISVVDSDQTPGDNFSYEIATPPTHGTLFYNGVAITTPNFTFTDLTLLTYSHDGSESTTPGSAYTQDHFTLLTTDDGGGTGVSKTTSSDITLNILPNDNDPILTHNDTQHLAPGDTTIVVTNSMLQVTDVDSPDQNLTYTVTGTPPGDPGYFTLNGALLVVGSTFTQVDIDAGRLSYVARTVSSTDRTDTLSFTVLDGGVQYYPAVRDGGIYQSDGKTLAVNTFSVVVPAQTGGGNAPPPPLPAPSGPVSDGSDATTVLEGATVTIGTGQLHVTDSNVGGGTDNIIYRVLTSPTSGTLMLNGVAVSQFGTFTQADIDAGHVTFVHSGAEDFIDGFDFSVSDGSKETATQHFAISATPQNDTPTASLTDKTPTVGEGGSIVIDDKYITLSDSDSQGDLPAGTQYANVNLVTFRIDGNVANGTLFLNGVAIGVGSIVSQADLDAGLLTYTHNGSETTSDSFSLTPLDDQGVVIPTATNHSSTGDTLVVTIAISPINDAPIFVGKGDASTTANPIYEGSSLVIAGSAAQAGVGGTYLDYSDTDNSTVQRQYRVTEAPVNGTLELNGVALGVGSVFTQDDLDHGRVTYVHDGSETRSDSFNYVVSDGDYMASETGSQPQGTANPITSTFHIGINPVNDAPVVTAPAGPVEISGQSNVNDPVGGFQVVDQDIGAPGGTDFVQATIRLLHADGSAFSQADYTSAGNTVLGVGLNGATMVGGHNGNGDYLVIQGTQAEVNAALASLTVSFPDNRNEIDQVQVIVDDRLRDATGALIGGANGGDANQAALDGNPPTAIPTDAIDGYTTAIPTDLIADVAVASTTLFVSETNEAPIGTAPATETVFEDVPASIGGFVIADAESDTFGLPVTVTLQAIGGAGSNGLLGIGGAGTQTSILLGNGHTVTISGDNTGTMTLTGVAGDIESVLNDPTLGLTYTSPLNGNADLNGAAAGDVTVRMTLSEGVAAVGGNVGSGSVANPDVVRDIAVTITPTNDAPTVLGGTGTVVIGSDATQYAIPGIQVGDPDTADGLSPGESDFEQVTVRLLNSDGTAFANAAAYAGILLSSTASGTAGATIDATFSGAANALVIRGTTAEVNAYLAGLQISFTSGISNSDKTYKVDVIVDDRLRANDGTLDGSNLAGGGLDLNSTSNPTGVVNVPTTNIDPYAATPTCLSQNIAEAMHTIFVSGTNDPTHITASDGTPAESTGIVALNAGGTITVTDADGVDSSGNPASNLHVVITTDKGTFSSFGGAAGGTATGLATNTITLDGVTMAQINAYLNGLQITMPTTDGVGGVGESADWNGTFHVTIVVNDEGNSGQRPATLIGDNDNPAANPGDFSYADGTSAALITTRVITMTVTPVNDAPTVKDATPVTMPAVPEDSTSNTPQTVGDLFGGEFVDTKDTVANGSTANNFAGVAISGNTSTAAQGTWQYFNGTVWVNIPTTVSNTNALVLDKSDLIRFAPAANYFGTPGTLSANLIDDSAGAVADKSTVNLTAIGTGGISVYSAATVALGTSITAVNDAPTLSAPSNIVLNEDVTGVANTGSNVGTLIGAHYSDATDNKSGIAGGGNTSTAVQGIVVLDNEADAATQGKWQYSTDGGNTWVDLPQGLLSGNNTEIFLPTTASLRFAPVANYNGAPPALSIVAVDASAGTRTAVQTGLNIGALGGTTQYSLATTLGATVNPVNDAPVFTGLGSTGTLVVTKGDPAVGLDGDGLVSVSDVDLITWGGTTFTVQRSGAASADDVFGFTPASGVTINGANVMFGGLAVGTLTNTGGKMTVTFATGVSAATVDAVMGGVSYRNVSTATTAQADVTLNFTLNDQDSNITGGGVQGSGQNQGAGGELIATHSITVQVNTNPVALGDSQVVTEGTTATGNVLTGAGDKTGGVDTDVDGDPLTVTGFSAGGVNGVVGTPLAVTGGLLTVNADGSYSFVPDANFHGSIPTVSYTISDGRGGSSTATLDIRENSPPSVVGVVNQTSVDSQAISVDASAWFADVEGPMTYAITGLPSGLTADASGHITGTLGHSDSQGGIAGVYTLTINATDSDGVSTGPQTFTWTITNPNPIANNDTGATTQSASTTGNVITSGNPGQSDSDPDGDPIAISQVNGVAGGVGASVNGTDGGTFIINANGTYSFVPGTDFIDLGVGQTRTTSVNYTLRDGDGGTATATLVVTVTGTNDAPTANNDTNTTDQNHSVGGNAITSSTSGQSDTDPDTGDVLTVSQVGGVAGNVGNSVTGSNGGLFTVNADGTYSFDPNGAFNRLQVGQTDTTSVTYQISDGHGGTSTASITVTVNGLNDAPTARNDTGATDQNTTTVGNVIASANNNQSDTDPDTSDVLTVTQVNGVVGNVGTAVAGDHGGQFTLNANGTYSFNPNGAFADLAAGITATTSINYEISDGHGGTSDAVLTVTVTGVNDAPIVQTPLPPQTGQDHDTVTSIPTAQGFSDVDIGDTLTYTATGLPPGLTIDGTTGVISGTIDHSASQGGVGGVYTIVVTATDGSGASVDQQFTYGITNPPPVAHLDTGTTDQNTVLTGGNVITSANPGESDVDPDGDALTVSLVNGSAGNIGHAVAGTNGGEFTLNADGTYSFDPNGNFIDLGANQSRTSSITYQVSDGEGGLSSTTLTVTVTGTNEAPTVEAALPPQAGVDHGNVSIDTSGGFTDIDHGDTLTYAAGGLPPGLSIDPSTGHITGTIDHSASQGGTDGAYHVTVTATDEHGANVSQTFVWQVTNPAPTADNDSGTTAEGKPLSGNVITNDNDPDGDTLTITGFSIAGESGTFAPGTTTVIPNVGTLTLSADGSYQFTPVQSYSGTVPAITYQVTDGQGGFATANLNIIVNRDTVQPLPADWIPVTPVGQSFTGPTDYPIFDPDNDAGLGDSYAPFDSGDQRYESDFEINSGPSDMDIEIGAERMNNPNLIANHGDVLRVDYWSVRPQLYSISRNFDPALFVTFSVRNSQEQAWWPHEEATIESGLINARLAMPHDLYVSPSVRDSQRLAAATVRQIEQQRLTTTPGVNPLFNDFDPLNHLIRAAGPNALHHTGHHATAHPKAAHAPSFTQQIDQAAGKTRAPAPRNDAQKISVKH
jgi:CshA-type fibril repeat protein